MNAYVKLGLAALLPIIMAAFLHLLNEKTSFGKWKPTVKQVLYGLAFGALAIVGTEWGIPINGAQVNCRDAAVLIAGLLFGGPAGIIAGFIGGIERWIAVAWGVGSFTRIACSVSTIVAGFYAAILRKLLFENRAPSWAIAGLSGTIMEVFHLTMVFVTNMSTPQAAITVVKACCAPMLIANGFSVFVAALGLSVLQNWKEKKAETDRTSVTRTIQRWLLVVVLLAFAITNVFVYTFQDRIADAQIESRLDIALDEVCTEVGEELISNANNRHIGETGFVMVINKNGKVISSSNRLPQSIRTADMEDIRQCELNTTFLSNYHNESFYCKCKKAGTYYVLAVYPKAEAVLAKDIAIYVNAFLQVMIYALLFAMVYYLVKKIVVNQIKSMNVSLTKIAGGNLDEVVNVRSSSEFSSLSDDINTTVDTLKQYISEASARIDQELEAARSIQISALPIPSEEFRGRKEFDLYASMDPAKEVGGDFYDCYLTEENKLSFLVADVSGKGIPAAMFMMRAKTELKRLTKENLPLADVFSYGNNSLCGGNDAGMFVTAMQGGLNLETGNLELVNAGHNPPIIRHADGTIEVRKMKAGFVLAGMEDIPYRSVSMKLEPGDSIFLYTDGVTEATNKENELFGEERLLAAIGEQEWSSMEEMCLFIRQKVEEFVDGADQFDDITMLALTYIGASTYPSIYIEEAKTEDVLAVTDFVDEQLDSIGCPMKTKVQLDIAIDELFSNIVKFAYDGKPGPVTVKFIYKEDINRVYLRFEDTGVPYNPVVKEDPDVTLSAEERDIGGLGIFLVKKTMDDMRYKYENETNILTIEKQL